MSFGYRDYVPARDKQARARKAAERLKKKNPDAAPVIIEGRKLAKTWWGVAWNKNLESYADYESRIGRGSAYVRNGMVLDLQISPGLVTGLVQGSGHKPYNVAVNIDKLSDAKWKKIASMCSHKIGSVAELAEGKFPEGLAELFTARGDGLFPSPGEIRMSCTCPDWATMCKHVAAVLYGIGARFDEDPLLFFRLRGIPFDDLLKKSVDQKITSMLKNAGHKSKRLLDGDVSEIFGI
jgi:uncharacterized Zn finger protein